MQTRTLFLSKLIGLYCILIPPCLAIHRQATVGSASGLWHNPPLMLVVGIFTVIGGLAMVLAHNLWCGGALRVVVTLVGWLTLLKGLWFLLLPNGADTELILNWLRDPTVFYVCMTPTFLIGIYLTYEGFKRRLES